MAYNGFMLLVYQNETNIAIWKYISLFVGSDLRVQFWLCLTIGNAKQNGWSAVSKLTYGSFTNGVTLCYPKSSLKEFSISHKHFGINPFTKGPSCWTLPFWCPIFLEHPIWKHRFSLPLPPAVASPSASNFCRGTWKVYQQTCGVHRTFHVAFIPQKPTKPIKFYDLTYIRLKNPWFYDLTYIILYLCSRNTC